MEITYQLKENTIPEKMLLIEIYNQALHDIDYYSSRYDYCISLLRKRYKYKNRRYTEKELLLKRIPHFLTAIDFIFNSDTPILELCFDESDYIDKKIKEKALESLKSEPRLFEMVKDLIN